MPAKVDILVGMQYRDKLSVGPSRVRLGQRAYHWSIIVAADGKFHRFDITDGVVQDPVTFQDTNPDRAWVYRHNVSDTLLGIPRYLGSIQINQKSPQVTVDQLATMFENIPIPQSTADRALHNCVSWTANAIRALQTAGHCQSFDLSDLQDFALTHADKRLADFKHKADPARYPPSSNFWLRLF